MDTTRRMGPYIIGETLGEGGFSKVKLGVHFQTGEKVALKILKKDALNLNSSTRKQVEREIRAMEKVQHRNVIRLIDVQMDAQYPKRDGTFADVILVILELATGGELFEFLSFTGSFDESIARTYFHQLIAGVEACHNSGIAHRDLKPENLLLDSQFLLKLADFGFASSFSGVQSVMFTECGTPGYMAPEMFDGGGYDPKAADVWACGVISFIMLAGFPPFQRPNRQDWWFDKLVQGKHALFWQAHTRSAYFSDSYKDFANKILNPDPTKRITLAGVKKHPWFLGHTISDLALQTELRRRKITVDEEKERARVEARQGQTTGAQDSLDGSVHRGLEDGPPLDDEGLPMFPPTIVGAAVQPQQQTLSMSVASSDDQLTEAKLPPVPAYTPEDRPECYTKFVSGISGPELLQRLSATLDKFQGQHSVIEEAYKLKATLLTAEGSVEFTVQIFERADDNKRVCEFRRRKGGTLHYRRVFEDVRQELWDVIELHKPPATSEPDDVPIESPVEST